mgnify:CR=1 FL=1
MMKRYAALTGGILLIAVTVADAQVGFSLRAGTLGLGGELSVRPSRYLGLRAGGHYFTTTRSATIEGIAYQITPKLRNGNAILDLHPLGNAFHLSGGVMWNSNQGTVAAELTGPVTIGPQTYQPAEIGELTGQVKYQERYAPYAGLGFGGRGRISFLFDAGIVFSGFPQISLTGGSNLVGQAKTVFDQNVQQEVQDIQTEIESRKYLKYTPVVSFGLRVGF